MALAPKFAGQIFTAGETPKGIHTLELYLDYVCPFSARIFKTLHGSVFPIIESRYGSRVRFILRQQIQPWHPSSTLVHEAAAIVLRLTPAKFYDFSAALFENQKEYFDISVKDETRNQTYKRLATLAANTVGVAEHEVYRSLEITGPGEDGSLNNGNKATDDIKLMVKANRMTGVHVTPTVVFNGVVENNISSSWTLQQWQEWLDKNIT